VWGCVQLSVGGVRWGWAGGGKRLQPPLLCMFLNTRCCGTHASTTLHAAASRVFVHAWPITAQQGVRLMHTLICAGGVCHI